MPEATEGRRRVVLRRVLTVLAGVLVYCALTAPREIDQLTPAAFLRLPGRGAGRGGGAAPAARPGPAGSSPRSAAHCSASSRSSRPSTWVSCRRSRGRSTRCWTGRSSATPTTSCTSRSATTAAVGASVLAVVLVVVVLVLMTLAAVRLAGQLDGRRRPATKVVAVLSVVWLGAAALGAQLVAPVPLASRSVAALAYQDATQIPVSLADRAEFEAQASVDAFRDTPNDELLTGLRGKDVVLGFVESYGRSALEDPRYAPVVDAALDAGSQELKSAGFAARSGFLTSPVAGGGSWLAHATFGSGLWIGNQQRDHSLVSSDRLTLSSAFQKGGWDTVAVMPGTISAWPDANFYGIDRVYGRDDLGYKGLNFSWSPMPDQYTLSQFQQREYGKPGRAPMMAELVLTSSHVPWTPVPKMVDWNAVGDGSGYDALVEGGRRPRRGVAGQRPRVRGLPRLDRLLGDQPRLLGEDLRQRQPGAGVPRRPPARSDHHRRRRQPRRAGDDRGEGPGRARPGRRAGAGPTGCGPRRRPRCGGWTPSATGSSPRSARTRIPVTSPCPSSAPGTPRAAPWERPWCRSRRGRRATAGGRRPWPPAPAGVSPRSRPRGRVGDRARRSRAAAGPGATSSDGGPGGASVLDLSQASPVSIGRAARAAPVEGVLLRVRARRGTSSTASAATTGAMRDRAARGVGDVPVVHGRLLHLVADDEPDVLVAAPPTSSTGRPDRPRRAPRRAGPRRRRSARPARRRAAGPGGRPCPAGSTAARQRSSPRTSAPR